MTTGCHNKKQIWLPTHVTIELIHNHTNHFDYNYHDLAWYLKKHYRMFANQQIPFHLMNLASGIQPVTLKLCSVTATFLCSNTMSGQTWHKTLLDGQMHLVGLASYSAKLHLSQINHRML